ncbi:hypothetical protein L7F22_036169, partial [Adiantum nelumboides]|nr:hypothetical protein [Adiantum nelumboides]
MPWKPSSLSLQLDYKAMLPWLPTKPTLAALGESREEPTGVAAGHGTTIGKEWKLQEMVKLSML